MSTCSLFYLLNTASIVVCNGYEIDSHTTQATANSQVMRIECDDGDDFQAYLVDQPVELDEDGHAIGEDRNGDPLDFEFKKIVPMTADDLVLIVPTGLVDSKSVDPKYTLTPYDGVHCPHCGSYNIESDSLDADGIVVTDDVSCRNCGSTWIDHFQLAGYNNLNVGKVKKNESL